MISKVYYTSTNSVVDIPYLLAIMNIYMCMSAKIF